MPPASIARVGCLWLLVATAFAPAPASQRATPPARETPRAQPSLLVGLVVDQMRADYVDRFESDWTRGLARLIREGARFTNAAYPYLGTYTCAGHATIATGAFPSRHGINQNTWYDRQRNRIIPCTDDATARGIAYSGTPRDGVGPARLRVPTLADVMRERRQARVVSLSLKSRSAIMLAGHGGHAVTWLGDSPDGWQTSSPFSGAPLVSVKSFLESHPIEADLKRVWHRLLAPPRYRAPDEGEGEDPVTGWSRTFPHRLGGIRNLPVDRQRAQWETSPFADERLGALAARLVETERLGQRGVTDVLFISFSSPDLVGHRFGPRSQEIQDMYAYLDRTIGHLLDRLDTMVGAGRYVVALSSDHGVAEIPAQVLRSGGDAGRLSAPTLSAIIESTCQSVLGPGRCVARINTNDIVFEPGVYSRLQSNPKGLERVMATLAAQPGIARVFRSDELSGGDRAADALRRAAALSHVPGQSGDLILALQPGWMFSTAATTHGTANAYDQRVPIVFFGAGIKPGRYADAVTPADIAPTLAALFDLSLSDAEGRVLTEALRSAAPVRDR